MADEMVDSALIEASASEVEEVVEDQTEANEKVDEGAEEAVTEDEETSEASEDGGDTDDEVTDIETVEVEYSGKKYTVPKDVKDALMREQDYTAKTTALADQRRAMEQEQQDFRQYAEASRAHSDKMAQLAAIDQQLAQYQAYDWNAAYDADLASATKLRHQMEQLQQGRNALVGEIQQAEGQRQHIEMQNLQRTAQRTEKQLAQEIPNWGDDLKSELGKFAVETMGFNPMAVSRAVTPQEIKALYYAHIGYKAVNAAKASATKAKQPKAAPEPPKKVQAKKAKAPTDLYSIKDPEEYRKAYLARKRKGR